MSKLKSNGDDHPEAAHQHLLDAHVLLGGQRPDGAAYQSGYVVECALKSLMIHEGSVAIPKGRKGHDVGYLAAAVGTMALVAGAKAGRYYGAATRAVVSAGISAWTPEMRYRAASMSLVDATSWYQEAEAVYKETVGQMRLDGVL